MDIETKIRQLKAMHELMLCANDEELYFRWIYIMPDEPSEDDFMDIARNEEIFMECYETFLRLIKSKNYL